MKSVYFIGLVILYIIYCILIYNKMSGSGNIISVPGAFLRKTATPTTDNTGSIIYTDATTGHVMIKDANGGPPVDLSTGGGVTDHGDLTGRGDDDHTQYALLAGRTSGQAMFGGTAAGETLTLKGNDVDGGVVNVDSTMVVNGVLIASGAATMQNTLDVGSNATVGGTLTVNNISSHAPDGDITLDPNGTGLILANADLCVNTIRSLTADSNITLSANGAGNINVADNKRITGLGNPSAPQDAATKNYVDSTSLQRQYAHVSLDAASLEDFTYNTTTVVANNAVEPLSLYLPTAVVNDRLFLYGDDEKIGLYNIDDLSLNWSLTRIELPVTNYTYNVLSENVTYVIISNIKAQPILPPAALILNQGTSNGYYFQNDEYILNPTQFTNVGSMSQPLTLEGNGMTIRSTANAMTINNDASSGFITIGSGAALHGQQIDLKSGGDGLIKINDNNTNATTFIGSNGTVGNITIGSGGLTNQQINISAGTNTNGQISFDGNKVICNAPINADKSVVTKEYADAIASGFGPKLSVRSKTTTADITFINNNANVDTLAKTITKTGFGTLTVDGDTMSNGDRVLFADASPNAAYGIYTVTNEGDNVSIPWVLTRSFDANDTPSVGEVRSGIYTFVTDGTTHINQGWALINYDGAELGVSTQSWSKVSQLAGPIAHSTLTGRLVNDEHPQYLYKAGQAGGQEVHGGNNDIENLVLYSTSGSAKGKVMIPETTQSTNTSTGALTVGGGVGIGMNLNVGEDVTVNNTVFTNNISSVNDDDHILINPKGTGTISIAKAITTSNNDNIILNPHGTGVVDVSSKRIANVAAPTSGTDAVNKNYVDLNSVRQVAKYYTGATYTFVDPTITVAGDITSVFRDVVLGDKVVVKNLGLFEITSVADPWVMTRIEIPSDNYVYDTTFNRTRTVFSGGVSQNINSIDFIDTEAYINYNNGDGPVFIGNISQGTDIKGAGVNITTDSSANINTVPSSGNVVIGHDNGNKVDIVGDVNITNNSNTIIKSNNTGLEIHNLVNPIDPTDAANKVYVDDSANYRTSMKFAVKVKPTDTEVTNILAGFMDDSGYGVKTITGPTPSVANFDGLMLVLFDRVLVVDVSSNSGNQGIYEVIALGNNTNQPYVLRRTDDELIENCMVLVFEGVENNSTIYRIKDFVGPIDDTGSSQTWQAFQSQGVNLTKTIIGNTDPNLLTVSGSNITFNTTKFTNISNSEGDSALIINTTSDSTLQLNSDTLHGSIVMGNNAHGVNINGQDVQINSFNTTIGQNTGTTTIYGVINPTNDKDAVNKYYNDRTNLFKLPVKYRTTNSEGALIINNVDISNLSDSFILGMDPLTTLQNVLPDGTIDGQTINVGDRIALIDELNTSRYQGIYDVINLGNGVDVVWRLDRSSDLVYTDNLAGINFNVLNGVEFGGSSYIILDGSISTNLTIKQASGLSTEVLSQGTGQTSVTKQNNKVIINPSLFNNIGTNITEDITIGSGTGAQTININSGTGDVNINTGTNANEIRIGNANGSSGVTIASNNIECNASAFTVSDLTNNAVLSINSGNAYFSTNTFAIYDKADNDTEMIAASAGTVSINPSGNINIGTLNDNNVISIGSNVNNGQRVDINSAEVNIKSNSGTVTINYNNQNQIALGSGNGNQAIFISAGSGGGYVELSGSESFCNIPITNDNSIATKEYVDSVAQGLGPKLAVRVKTTTTDLSNVISLGTPDNIAQTISGASGTLTIDGVLLSQNDRVLVADTAAANYYGIYYLDVESPWVLKRTIDADNTPSSGEVSVGIYTFVQEGVTHSAQGWALITFNGDLGNDNQTWSQITSAGGGVTDVQVSGTGLSVGTAGSVKTVTLDSTVITSIGTGVSGNVSIGSGIGSQAIALSPGTGGVTISGALSSSSIFTGTLTAPVLSSTFSASFTGTLSATGTTTLGSVVGTPLNFNVDSGSNATNINTGTTTGSVTIGGNGNQTVSIRSNITPATSTSFGNLNIGSTLGSNYDQGGNINIGVTSRSVTTNICTGTTTGILTIGGSCPINIAPGGTSAITILNGTTSGGIGICNGSSGGDVVIGQTKTGGSINIGVSGTVTTRINTDASSSVLIASNNNNTTSIKSDCASGTLELGARSGTSSINIGTGSSGTIAIGGTSTGQTLNIKSGVSGSGSGSFGTVSIGSNLSGFTGGTINIGATAGATNINIGTGSTTGDVAIGNTAATVDVTINGNTIAIGGSGTGSLSIGNPSKLVSILSDLGMSGLKIYSLGLASQPDNAASKRYVDDGSLWKNYVSYRTPDAVCPVILNAGSYSSNILTATNPAQALSDLIGTTIDGQTFGNGDRILIAATDGTSSDNRQGIYIITSKEAPWTLTRAADMEESIYFNNSSIKGITIPVRLGTLHSKSFVVIRAGTFLDGSAPTFYETMSATSGASISGSVTNGAITVFDSANNTIRVGASIAANTPTITTEGQIIIPSVNTLANIIYGRDSMPNYHNITNITSNVTAFGCNIMQNLGTSTDKKLTMFGKNLMSGITTLATNTNLLIGTNIYDLTASSQIISNCIAIGNTIISTANAGNCSDSIYIGNNLYSTMAGVSTIGNNCVINRTTFSSVGNSTGNCILGSNSVFLTSSINTNVLLGNNSVTGATNTASLISDNCVVGSNTIARSTFIPDIRQKTIVGRSNTVNYNAEQAFNTTSDLSIIGNSNSYSYQSTVSTDLPDLIFGNRNTYIQSSGTQTASTKGHTIIIGNNNSLSIGSTTTPTGKNIIIGNNMNFNGVSHTNLNKSILIGNDLTVSGTSQFGTGVILINPNTVTYNFNGSLSNATILNSTLSGGIGISGGSLINSSVSGTSSVANSTFIGSGSVTLNSPATFNQCAFLHANGLSLSSGSYTSAVFWNSLTQSSTGSTVVIASNGQIGPTSSIRASKNTIEPFAGKYDSTEIIDQLEPKTYNFNMDNSASIGLIAEDVFPIIPEICPTNAAGEPVSIRYDLLSVILLEEIKKQKAIIASQKNTIDAILARLDAAGL